jgi:dipeptidyl aminopeptidase/acylaminoacyl peptidase
LFGGTPKEKLQLYEAASPITYIEQIIAPILVIQANDDTRCPARQMRTYEIKMCQLNKDFEIEWHSGGHFLNNTEQSISHVERMLHWTHRVLNMAT